MKKNTERLTRQQQAQQTKKCLFDAAYTLLQEKDFKDITISDIVKRAGVSAGTFYLYYTSKLDVYYQTYAFADSYFLQEVADKVCSGSTKDRLLTFFGAYAYYNSEYTGIRFAKLLFNSDNKLFLRDSDGMHSVLSSIVQYGLATGELDGTFSAERHINLLMDMARGITYNWCVSDGSFDLNNATCTGIERLYSGLRGEQHP